MPGAILRYCFSDVGEEQFTFDGAPIWPLVSTCELKALTELTSWLGCGLEYVNPTKRDALPATQVRTGNVVASSRTFLPLAKLYGFLTGRNSISFVDPSDLHAIPPTDILLIHSLDVTARLMSTLYVSSSGDSSTGLLIAETVEELRRTVLLKAAVAYLTVHDLTTDLTIDTLSDFKSFRTPDRTFICNDAIEHYHRSRSVNMLSLFTHGDGLDLSLGSRAVCAVPHELKNADSHRRMPTCVTRGVCYRLNEPIGRAKENGRLLTVDALSSRILILASCWGINPSPALIEYRWSLIKAFQRAENVGSVILTWKISFVAAADLERLGELVRTMNSLGEAVAVFNKEQFIARSGLAFSIVGDPSVRYTRDRLERWTYVDWLPPHVSTSGPTVNPLNSSFARSYLAGMTDHISDEMTAKQHRKATLALDTHDAIDRLPKKGGDDAPNKSIEFGKTITLLAALRGTLLTKDWLVSADRPRSVGRDICFCCGEGAALFSATIASVGQRYFVNCPRCGIVEDFLEHDSRVPFKISDNSVELTSGHSILAGTLLIEPDFTQERQIIPFEPGKVGGGTAHIVRFPQLIVGFYYLAVFSFSNGNIIASRMPIYQD